MPTSFAPLEDASDPRRLAHYNELGLQPTAVPRTQHFSNVHPDARAFPALPPGVGGTAAAQPQAMGGENLGAGMTGGMGQMGMQQSSGNGGTRVGGGVTRNVENGANWMGGNGGVRGVEKGIVGTEKAGAINGQSGGDATVGVAGSGGVAGDGVVGMTGSMAGAGMGSVPGSGGSLGARTDTGMTAGA